MDRVDDLADVGLLLGTFAFMIWARARSYERFITPDRIYLAGNDAYYHLREINYIVRHWPFPMPFDPWTNFPLGTSQGQFGTLFDITIATAAIIVGGGDPSSRLIAIVTATAPVIIGSLVILPVYGIGRKIGDRMTARSAVVVLALIPGVFYTRSLFGSADHNIAEVLLQATAVLTFVVAIEAARRDQPVWENVIDRDSVPLRRTVGYSLLAGFAVLLYVLVWPPAVVLIGIIGTYFLITIVYRAMNNEAIDQLVFVGTISFFGLGIALLPAWNGAFSATRLSSLQAIAPLMVSLACVYLAVLDRRWPDIDRSYYPVVAGGTVIVGVLGMMLLTPDLFRVVIANVGRVFAFGTSGSTKTIAEAQPVPFGQLGAYMFQQYGLLMFSAVVGFGLLLKRRQHTLLVVWSAAIFIMALNQVRFHYYLAVNVAILSGVAFSLVFDTIDLTTFKEIEPYQVLSIIAVIIFVMGPLAPLLGTTTVFNMNNSPGSVQVWAISLDWLESETPEPDLEYYGSYEQTNDFDYVGEYGVLSWWDYGHWITVEGERIAVANPFQQHARLASEFFLSMNESQAEKTIGSASSREPIKYIMIDWQMVGGKFPAIATWTGPGPGYYYSTEQRQVANTQAMLHGTNNNYRDTMIAKLYFGDAVGLSHYRLVHETEQRVAIGSVARLVRGQIRSTNYINRYLSSSVINTVNSRTDLRFYSVRQAAAVKTYEHVPGAVIVGQSNATNVTLRLPLRTNGNRTFVYSQTVTVSNGTYRAVVPYSTGQNGAVRAVSDYIVMSNNRVVTAFEVSESAVQNGSRVVVSV